MPTFTATDNEKRDKLGASILRRTSFAGYIYWSLHSPRPAGFALLLCDDTRHPVIGRNVFLYQDILKSALHANIPQLLEQQGKENMQT